MTCFSRRSVERALRYLGFLPTTGNGSGHDVWIDQLNRVVHPLLRKRDIHSGQLYALGAELEAKGVCSRRGFTGLVQAFELTPNPSASSLKAQFERWPLASAGWHRCEGWQGTRLAPCSHPRCPSPELG